MEMAKSAHTFRQDVIILRDDGKSTLPNRFDNEIYYARNCNSIQFEPGEVRYESNISLKYVYDGSESYLINGKKKEVRSGQLLFVNDQSDVSLISSKGNTASIFLDADLVADCFNSSGHSSDGSNCQVDKMVPLFDDTILNGVNEFEALKRAIDHNSDVIIPVDFYYEIASTVLSSQLRIKSEIDKVSSLKESTRVEIYRKLNIARCYLHDTTNKRFNLNSLACEACMSKFHLIRHFKEVFGLTPHRYFIAEKLKRANDLLRYSCLPIKDIAHNLGYPDTSSFGKQYKQVYGVSPIAHRT